MQRALKMDAGTALLRATANLVNFHAVVEEMKSRNWASITFTGARHEIVLRLEGDGADAAADRFCESVGAAEFELRGHIVADISVVAREPAPDGGIRLRIEALTVEEA